MRKCLFAFISCLLIWFCFFPKLIQAGIPQNQMPVSGDHLKPHDSIEINAKARIRSKDFFSRLEGIQALRQYRSEENTCLLVKLLSDPWFYLYGEKKVFKRYPVREAAYKVLRDWNISVPPPVVEEPVYLD